MKIDVPKSFYEEEERCGYRISADMKKVWAQNLKLLGVFDDVCRKYHISWYIAYGNLLGAVRHKGYVPWDDDIDVFVSRKGYDKLCRIAGEAFQEPYFFQNDRTDPGSHTTFAKLRDSSTTAIYEFERPSRYQFNQGMFLDIFPLDNVPDDPAELEKYRKQIRVLKRGAQVWARLFDAGKIYFGRKKSYISLPLVLILRVFVRLLHIPNIPCRLFERACKKYNGKKTECCAMPGLGEVIPYKKESFKNKVMLPFEFIEVPAPADYEDVLDREYGNWHVFVRGGAGKCMHSEGMQYDTEHSYKEVTDSWLHRSRIWSIL